MAKYSMLKSTNSCAVYIDECDRKESLGQPRFGICDLIILLFIYILWIISLPLTWWCSFKVIPQFQRVVIFRLGRLQSLKGPGLILIIPCVDKWKRVDMRTRAFKVPPQEIFTLDRALYKVGADVQYRISDPLANTLIEDTDHSLRGSAHAALSSSLSCEKLKFIQSEKYFLQTKLQSHMNKAVSNWGIEIARFELTHSFVLKGPCGSDPAADEAGDEVGGGAAIINLLKSLTSSSTSFHMPGMTPTGVQQSSPKSNGKQPPLLSPDEFFCLVKGVLDDELCEQVQAVFQFHVSDDLETKVWVIDLKHAPGFVKSGPTSDAVDVCFKLNRNDFQKIFYGRISATDAYMNGSLTIDGSLQTAMKLESLVKKLKGT